MRRERGFQSPAIGRLTRALLSAPLASVWGCSEHLWQINCKGRQVPSLRPGRSRKRPSFGREPVTVVYEIWRRKLSRLPDFFWAASDGLSDRRELRRVVRNCREISGT